MKLPAQLSKGLSENELKQLESFLKRAKKYLKPWLEDSIEKMIYSEEVLMEDGLSPDQIAYLLGRRRGYRDVLGLLPED